MRSLIISHIIISGILLIGAPLYAQDQYDELFASDQPLKIDLQFDFKELLKNKYKEEYVAADFEATFEDGTQISEGIKIRARGNLRKQYCNFPPIKLNFKGEKKGSSKFLGQKKLKLVTPCKGSEVFQQYVYGEFLAYKMFNLISDLSFRVRLVELRYIDKSGKKKPMEFSGFLIEDVDDMAARNECREMEIPKFSQRLVEHNYMAKVSLFQYAIGNTDWKIENIHNVKILQTNDPINQILYAVPYDFDYAGLVNAMYAVPQENLGLTSVRERLYLGIYQNEARINESIDIFLSKEIAIHQLIDEFEPLDKGTRIRIKRYLKEFYSIIKNPFLVRNNILSMTRR